MVLFNVSDVEAENCGRAVLAVVFIHDQILILRFHVLMYKKSAFYPET